MRYGDKLEVFYDVEDETKSCLVPRFILQPIIENSILHGIAPKANGGIIEIRTEICERNLIIRIEDDGVGMDAEKVDHINHVINLRRMESDENSGVGVKNVNQRIEFVYGDEYGVRLSSSSNQGSSCIITIPAKNPEWD